MMADVRQHLVPLLVLGRMDYVDHQQESVLLSMFVEVVAKMKLAKVSPGTRPDSDCRVGDSELEVKDLKWKKNPLHIILSPPNSSIGCKVRGDAMLITKLCKIHGRRPKTERF